MEKRVGFLNIQTDCCHSMESNCCYKARKVIASATFDLSDGIQFEKYKKGGKFTKIPRILFLLLAIQINFSLLYSHKFLHRRRRIPNINGSFYIGIKLKSIAERKSFVFFCLVGGLMARV